MRVCVCVRGARKVDCEGKRVAINILYSGGRTWRCGEAQRRADVFLSVGGLLLTAAFSPLLGGNFHVFVRHKFAERVRRAGPKKK